MTIALVSLIVAFIVVIGLAYLWIALAIAAGESLYRERHDIPPLTMREVLSLSHMEK